LSVVTREAAARALETIMGEEWPPLARALVEWVGRNAPVKPASRPRFWVRFRCAHCTMRWEQVVPVGSLAPLVVQCPGCDRREYVQMVAILRMAEPRSAT
jgi:hypothetical protein